MKFGQSWIYEVLCDERHYRSFSTEARAFEFFSIARELCPQSKWELVKVPVYTRSEVSE